MRGGQGVVLVCMLSASLGGWEDSGQECSGNACFDPASQNIQVVRSKTSSTGLKYKEKSNDKVSVEDMMAVCLPGVDKAFMASTFKSCENKKLTSVCTMKERGWLVADGDETVANEAALLSAGSGLAGGEEAVRDCLKLAEEVEEYEYEYYYYDYADYGDEWDYLEEAGGQVRQRREAGIKTKPEEKITQRQRDRKVARKSEGNEAKKGRNSKKGDKKGEKKEKKKADKKGKKGRSSKTGGKKEEKKGKKKADKKEKRGRNKGKGNEEKKEAKALRKAAKKAAKEEAKLEKAEEDKKEKERKKDEKKKDLGKLGFKKMPSKSTISRLRCIHTKFSDLMVACAKANLS